VQVYDNDKVDYRTKDIMLQKVKSWCPW